jgi:transposase
MGLKRRRFTREFKLQVVREIEAGKPVARVAREHQIDPTLISRWRHQQDQYGERAFAGNGQAYTEDVRVAELERVAGRLVAENMFLKKAWQRLEQQARARANDAGK